MSKFNPDLIQKARKGEIAILNDGSVEELREVLIEVWPNDTGSKRAEGCEKFYYKDGNNTWGADQQTHLPANSVKDFFMPDTYYPDKKEPEIKIHPMGETVLVDVVDQPRTYKVTRGQMKEIWEAAPIIARQSVRQDAEKMFSVFENEAEITGGDVEVIVKYFFKPYPDLLKSIFPEYFYIPEGEPVLVRQRENAGWVIRVSNGTGAAYIDGNLSGPATEWRQIIPFTKNPPK